MTPERVITTYTIDLGGNCAGAATKPSALVPFLTDLQPGTYVIFEVTTPHGGMLSPVRRRWGVAIKEADGRVELQPDAAG